MIRIPETDQTIKLETEKPVFIGRSRETKLKSLKLSRKQVQLILRSPKKLEVKQIAKFHNSYVNGNRIGHLKSHILKPSDKLELLNLRYSVEFIPQKTMKEEYSQSTTSSEDTFKASNMSTENGASNGAKRAKVDEQGKPSSESKEEPASKTGWVVGLRDEYYVFTDTRVLHRNKIAAFDMDSTLICTKSGRVFAKDASDWQIMLPEIPKKLRNLFEEERYKIVIFTNQKGLSNGRCNLIDFKQKIEAINAKLPVPLQVFVSCGSGRYRKPMTEMWESLLEGSDYNGRVSVDRTKSFYCGDAAGRSESGRRKKDHSCADRLFAINLGVQFYTPEMLFQNKKAEPFTMPDFDPRTASSGISSSGDGRQKSLLDPSEEPVRLSEQELVLLVGYPASGKSTVVNNYFNAKHGYVHINRDTLKTAQACLKLVESSLNSRKSVIVDNTNPDSASRKPYIDAAKSKNVKCRCLVMKANMNQALHNNKFRLLRGADKAHKGINEMILHSYAKKFKEPTVAEGFHSVARVNLIPHFEDEQSRKLYCQFLLEK